MTGTAQERLASWRMLLDHGGPSWLMEHAPRIVRELEAEVAAQGTEAQRAETVQLGSVHDGPVVASSDDAPNPCDPSPNSSQDRV